MAVVKGNVTKPWTRIALAIWAGAWLASCATPPPAGQGQAGAGVTPGAAPSTATAPPAVQPEPPRPPSVPELSPAQARAQAQAKAIEAIDQLQNGDVGAASQTIDQVLTLDPTNELGKKLREQITADAEKELGTTFFRYTVQPGDSLSRLAQQHLGDRFRFWILAKYNDIANPSKLAAGQVIRIPGRAPAAVPPAAARPRIEPETVAKPGPAPETEPPAAPPQALQSDVRALVQKAAQLQKSGDLEGAYVAYGEAARRDSGNREAVSGRESTKQALIRRYEREAVQAFQRQNLDMAIARWNSVLELDPNNQKAKLERERAADLKKRMAEKFGG